MALGISRFLSPATAQEYDGIPFVVNAFVKPGAPTMIRVRIKITAGNRLVWRREIPHRRARPCARAAPPAGADRAGGAARAGRCRPRGAGIRLMRRPLAEADRAHFAALAERKAAEWEAAPGRPAS